MAIQQKFTGDASQLEKEYNKILQQQIKLEQQLHEVTNAAKNVAKSHKDAGTWAQQAGKQTIAAAKSMVLQYIGVQQAIALVNNELKRKQELENRAKDIAIRIADAEAQVVVNIGDVDTKDLQKFIADIGQIQKDVGFQSVAPLLEAASTTLSGTAGNQELTKDIVKTMAPFFRGNQDELSTGTSATASLAMATQANAKETAALVLGTMGQARIEGLEAFKNVAPAVAAGVATQKNIDPRKAAQESAALFASLGIETGDVDGAVTKTAVVALSAALERNFPVDPKKFDAAIAAGSSVGDANKIAAISLAERLDLAQALGARVQSAINEGRKPLAEDIAVQEDLLREGFRAANKTIVRDLLSGDDNKAAKQFDQALSKINFDTSIVDRKTDQLMGATENLFIASETRKLEGSAEGAFAGSDAKMIATIKSQVSTALDTPTDLGAAGVNATIAKGLMAFRGGTVEGAAEEGVRILEGWQKAIRQGSFGDSGSLVPTTDADLSEKDKQQLRVIDDAIKSILDIQERNASRGSAAVQSAVQTERD